MSGFAEQLEKEIDSCRKRAASCVRNSVRDDGMGGGAARRRQDGPG